MKDRPILFSAPMVRALLDGTKTQTRRVLKDVTQWIKSFGYTAFTPPGCISGRGVLENNGPAEKFFRIPYGQPGDRLLVRETFFSWGRWETRFSPKKGRDEWHFVDMTLEAGKSYYYAADGLPAGYAKHHGGRGGITPTWWKRPAIHMPRWASRITLEITGVRVERLQDISEADAIAEGVNVHPDHFGKPRTSIYSPVQAYLDLWESINGPDSWDANSWVWVVEFKRVTS